MTTKWEPVNAKMLLVMALDPREIGQRIQQARQARHWTQLEFAQQANVSPSSVARWEAGKLPPVRELIRIADVLGVAAEQLVEEPTPERDLVAERLDRLEEMLAEVHRAVLPPRRKSQPR